jgi:hypothetical protein
MTGRLLERVPDGHFPRSRLGLLTLAVCRSRSNQIAVNPSSLTPPPPHLSPQPTVSLGPYRSGLTCDESNSPSLFLHFRPCPVLVVCSTTTALLSYSFAFFLSDSSLPYDNTASPVTAPNTSPLPSELRQPRRYFAQRLPRNTTAIRSHSNTNLPSPCTAFSPA